MNNTKWNELRLAMFELDDNSPKWRIRCTTNGYISDWDGEWYYHFSVGGYDDIEWVEIKIDNEIQKNIVHSLLKNIHVPGYETGYGFKIYGYIEQGKSIDYI